MYGNDDNTELLFKGLGFIGLGAIIMAFICFIIFALIPEQDVVKYFGGTMTIDLEPNKKLLDIDWTSDDLWIKTRTMRADEEAEVYEFNESSAWGVFEGTVIVREHKIEDNVITENVEKIPLTESDKLN